MLWFRLTIGLATEGGVCNLRAREKRGNMGCLVCRTVLESVCGLLILPGQKQQNLATASTAQYHVFLPAHIERTIGDCLRHGLLRTLCSLNSQVLSQPVHDVRNNLVDGDGDGVQDDGPRTRARAHSTGQSSLTLSGGWLPDDGRLLSRTSHIGLSRER